MLRAQVIGYLRRDNYVTVGRCLARRGTEEGDVEKHHEPKDQLQIAVAQPPITSASTERSSNALSLATWHPFNTFYIRLFLVELFDQRQHVCFTLTSKSTGWLCFPVQTVSNPLLNLSSPSKLPKHLSHGVFILIADNSSSTANISRSAAD